VFVTENGIFLPRLENDQSIAAQANDARVVIDNIHTGGVVGPPSPIDLGPNRAFGTTSPPVATSAQVFAQTFAVGTLRTLSDLTGGQTTAFQNGTTFFDRIDRTTRSGYLLGYYPSNSTWDGRYRRVSVKVNRPGVTVLFRHGYYVEQQIVSRDRRQFLTYSRIASAGGSAQEVPDLKVTAEASVIKGEGAAREVSVDVMLDPSRVSFKIADDRHVAAIDIAFFCGDARQNLVGELWQKIDLKLTGESYQRMMREGISYTARIPVKGDARYVKVVVYDYGADLVGTAVAKLQ
jgi:hypothetical protein